MAIFFSSLGLVRLALLSLYLRLFQVSRLAFWMIWVGAILSGSFYFITTVVMLARCRPRLDPAGDCMPVSSALYKGSGVFGLVSDLYILAIPVWQVSRLTLPPGRRAGVLAVFLTGLL